MKFNEVDSTERKKRRFGFNQRKQDGSNENETCGLIVPKTTKSFLSGNRMLNKNRVFYESKVENIHGNKLITPVVNRPNMKGSQSLLNPKTCVARDFIPFTPESYKSFKPKDCLKKSMVQIKNFLKSNKRDFNASPQTNFSPNGVLKRPLLNLNSFEPCSIQQSPNPLNVLKQIPDPSLSYNNPTYENQMDSRYVNNFMINPQTNNNFNIYNLIENHSEILKKRNFSELEIRKKKHLSLKKVSKPKILNQNSNISFNRDSDEITMKLRIKRDCLKRCTNNVIKKNIFDLVSSLSSSTKNCVELSFDNSSNQKYFHQMMISHQRAQLPRLILPSPNVPVNDSFHLIQNIVWNSFLRNNTNNKFKNQLKHVIKSVVNKLKNNDKLIYHKVNIFTLINLQVPLENKKFHCLSNPVKLRVICMLFAKYVNRKPFSQLCSNFLESIDLEKESSSDLILFK
jgi:hypothetical protein